MSASRPLKPYLNATQQLALLRSRGLAIPDDAIGIQALARFGYYRLSGYYYPLRKTNPVGVPGRRDEFVDNSSLELVIQLAEFDKGLRLLALDALESVETAVRVAIAHRLGKFDPLAHTKPRLLDPLFTTRSRNPRTGRVESPYDIWTRKFGAACLSSKEEFAKHHRQHYPAMPIWVAVELWDFGLLSRFFEGLQRRDRDALAAMFAPIDGPTLVNWLRCFNFIRNVAAHHSRLWNRTLPDVLALPAREKCLDLEPVHAGPNAKSKVFGAFTCLRLLLRKIHPDSKWHVRFKEHIATFPHTELVSMTSGGFEPGWTDAPIWAEQLLPSGPAAMPT